jgi:hypothetical protein
MTDPFGRKAGEPATDAPTDRRAHGSTAVGAAWSGRPAAGGSIADDPTAEVVTRPAPGQSPADQPTDTVGQPSAGPAPADESTTVVRYGSHEHTLPSYPAPWAGGHGTDQRYTSSSAAAGPPSYPGWSSDTDQPRYDAPHRDQGRDEDEDDGRTRTVPEYTSEPVAVRRPDNLAGLLLLLAGMAAGVSLLLLWTGGGPTGLEMVTSGVEDVQYDVEELVGDGTWQALAVVFGGCALFVLGLLLFVPARTHRFLGVLALLVTLVVAAGVLVPLAEEGWDVSGYEVGAWFTVAVAGLGLLGALKALMTGPRRR